MSFPRTCRIACWSAWTAGVLAAGAVGPGLGPGPASLRAAEPGPPRAAAAPAGFPVRADHVLATSPDAGAMTTPALPGTVPVWVTAQSWHVCLTVRGSDLAGTPWPGARDFAGFPYVNFSWGNRTYYLADTISVPVVLQLFRPTSGVLHVMGLREDPVSFFERRRGRRLPMRFFGHLKTVRLDLTPAQLARLRRHIFATYRLTARGQPIRIRREQRDYLGWFYEARGQYCLPRSTCASWVAGTLDAGGYRCDPARSTFAGGVIKQAGELAAARTAAGFRPPRPEVQVAHLEAGGAAAQPPPARRGGPAGAGG